MCHFTDHRKAPEAIKIRGARVHNLNNIDLDMISNADYVVDMGPDGGEAGNERSVTGRYLTSCH